MRFSASGRAGGLVRLKDQDSRVEKTPTHCFIRAVMLASSMPHAQKNLASIP